MAKDILIAIILIVLLLIFYYWNSPRPSNNSEKFTQEDNFEPDTAFDSSANSLTGDEKHGSAFHDEDDEKKLTPSDKKSQVIVFLGKHCGHCITYDKEHFPRLKGKLNKLGNGNIIVKKVYSDNDPNNLFNKYNIQYVPAGVVIHNNKKAMINGEISPSNSLKTIKKLSN